MENKISIPEEIITHKIYWIREQKVKKQSRLERHKLLLPKKNQPIF